MPLRSGPPLLWGSLWLALAALAAPAPPAWAEASLPARGESPAAGDPADAGPVEDADRAAAPALGERIPGVDAGISIPGESSDFALPHRDSPGWGPFEMLGDRVAPGERRRLTLLASETFAGMALPTPVIVVRGSRPGPTLCIVAGIHGDEIVGIEIARRVLQGLDPTALGGTVVGVPIANSHGFRRGSRYLPDRRDLNRYFPGRPRGSTASRIAYRLFEQVVRHCDALVDLHTGSFYRTNLRQVRADLRDPAVLDLALRFGAPAVVHSRGTLGTLRRAAVAAGIPAITYEGGQPTELQEVHVVGGVEGLRHLLVSFGMISEDSPPRGSSQVFRRSRWIRVDEGGILLARVDLGDRVFPGTLLGTVVDPVTNERSEVRSPHRGLVIGMALNQVVIPGFAAFHVGLEPRAGERPEEPGPETLDYAPAEDPDDHLEREERPE